MGVLEYLYALGLLQAYVLDVPPITHADFWWGWGGIVGWTIACWFGWWRKLW